MEQFYHQDTLHNVHTVHVLIRTFYLTEIIIIKELMSIYKTTCTPETRPLLKVRTRSKLVHWWFTT